MWTVYQVFLRQSDEIIHAEQKLQALILLE